MLAASDYQTLVEQIFAEIFTSLTNIRVEKGCICVTWLARKSAIPSLIVQAQERTEFMQLVGVLRVSVAGIDILERDTFLSSALVSAACADCVEWTLSICYSVFLKQTRIPLLVKESLFSM